MRVIWSTSGVPLPTLVRTVPSPTLLPELCATPLWRLPSYLACRIQLEQPILGSRVSFGPRPWKCPGFFQRKKNNQCQRPQLKQGLGFDAMKETRNNIARYSEPCSAVCFPRSLMWGGHDLAHLLLVRILELKRGKVGLGGMLKPLHSRTC